MHTGALKHGDVRCCILTILTWLLVMSAAAQAAVPENVQSGGSPVSSVLPVSDQAAAIKGWGPYLDVAFELTYWDKAEIREWREKLDRETGATLAAYITSWNAKLATPLDNAGIARKEGPQPAYQERDYLRLAIAQTVDYLQSDNPASLLGAVQMLDRLKEKGSMPEIAFWTGFVNALQAMESRNSQQFVAQLFDIWNNSVMYVEQGRIDGKTPVAAAGASPSYYYRNIVNLVVNRAIIDRKLEDLDALGPLFMMLNERDLEEKDNEGNYLTSLVLRIAEGMTAPDSDRFRLNFTVASIESKRLQLIADAKLDSEGMSENAQTAFEQARLFNSYALKWAASSRSSGAVSTVADYLDSASFAIQRLAGNEKSPAYLHFAMLPTHDGSSTLIRAMAVFNDLATYGEGGWDKAGYANHGMHLKSAHRLWRAIMELALWSGDFYLAKLNGAADQQNIMNHAAPLQVVLNSYLDFLASQKSRGFAEVIPDSAYFGAAEAAEKLAYSYQRVHAFSTDNTAYNLWFLRSLQATELFPFNPAELVRTAAILRRDGRFNLFLDYYIPLAERIKQSGVVKEWLKENTSEAAAAVREYVGSIENLFTAVTEGGYGGDLKGTVAALPPYASALQGLREELQRKPDHPLHKLLRSFYLEEMQKNSSYTLLLKDISRLNGGR